MSQDNKVPRLALDGTTLYARMSEAELINRVRNIRANGKALGWTDEKTEESALTTVAMRMVQQVDKDKEKEKLFYDIIHATFPNKTEDEIEKAITNARAEAAKTAAMVAVWEKAEARALTRPAVEKLDRIERKEELGAEPYSISDHPGNTAKEKREANKALKTLGGKRKKLRNNKRTKKHKRTKKYKKSRKYKN